MSNHFTPERGQSTVNPLDWHFDGDDIIAVCRTAYDEGAGGAHSYRDANFLTFHRRRNFRSLSLTDRVSH